jgi:hypothetical protein
MKVFLSWSGERSRLMAIALRDWLPLILHFTEPWLSETDIEAGQRWALTLAKELETSNFGILCLTRDNVASPWVLFEAGSLAKFLEDSRVIPFLLDLELRELSGPIAQFQAKKVSKESTHDLLRSINQAAERPVEQVRLAQLFDLAWPRLENILGSIQPSADPVSPARPQGEILEELVTTIRAMDARTRLLEEQVSQITALSWEEEARSLLLEGNKIQAIKLIRERVGIGLKEAKNLAEAWERALRGIPSAGEEAV